MDENIYSLLLKSASGVTLLGTLRYTIDFSALAEASGPDQQQQSTVTGVIYPVRATLTVPFLTGAQPLPLNGSAFYLLMLQPLQTFLAGDANRPLVVLFNPIGFERIAGGLQWQPPGMPTAQIFSFLGRRLALPV